MNVLLDSDVVIEIINGRDQAIREQWEILANSTDVVLFTPVTAAEVWGGAHPRERQATSLFFSLITCIPLDYEIGSLAGELLLQFRKSHSLKIADALIAASAIRMKAALWTRNRKHYPMPQLALFN